MRKSKISENKKKSSIRGTTNTKIMEQKYIAYLRQSSLKQQRSGLSIIAQREIIKNYVKSESLIISEYTETESGKKSDRPILKQALEEAKKTGATLIVAKLDRLARSVSFISNLLESDVEIKFCDFPEANKLVLHIISSIAEYEANLVSLRTSQALAVKKSQGVKLGNPENLTSNLDRALSKSIETKKRRAHENPNNKRAVAMLRILSSQGMTQTEMADKLNSEGFQTSRGCKFSQSSVRVLLKRYDIR